MAVSSICCSVSPGACGVRMTITRKIIIVGCIAIVSQASLAAVNSLSGRAVQDTARLVSGKERAVLEMVLMDMERIQTNAAFLVENMSLLQEAIDTAFARIDDVIDDASDSVETPAMGTGLSLAIYDEIIQHFDGTILGDSALAKGSKSLVTLPAAQEHPA